MLCKSRYIGDNCKVFLQYVWAYVFWGYWMIYRRRYIDDNCKVSFQSGLEYGSWDGQIYWIVYGTVYIYDYFLQYEFSELNCLWHCLHLWLFSPIWVFLCLLRLTFDCNTVLQMLHAKDWFIWRSISRNQNHFNLCTLIIQYRKEYLLLTIDECITRYF